MTINVYSPETNGVSGYGRIASALSQALAATLHHSSEPVSGDVAVLMGYPTNYDLTAKRHIAVTMYESDQLPDGWTDILNRCDLVIVPTVAQAAIFEATVTAPIRVAPLGINPVFHPEHIGDQSHGVRYSYKRKVQRSKLLYSRRENNIIADDPFVVICWGDRNERKGWDVAVKAFHQAALPHARLIVKCRDGSNPYDLQVPGVEMLRADLSDQALNDLYMRCDAMIFPSRGEGFGLPPREFACTGGLSSGLKFWATDVERWGYSIPYQMTDSDELGGQWAEPEQERVVRLLKYWHGANPHMVETMGQKAAVYGRRVWTWKALVDLLKGVAR